MKKNALNRNNLNSNNNNKSLCSRYNLNILIHLNISDQGEKTDKLKNVFVVMYKEKTVWITTNCGKFLKRWEYQTTLPASREICM